MTSHPICRLMVISQLAEATAAELALVKARNNQHTNTTDAGSTPGDNR